MTEAAHTPVATKRTGGRSALVMSAVRTAVEQLVEERGRDRVTIPMIAERAGVNPTSVYRRWGDAATVINDIATYRLDPSRPIPNTSDLKADLTGWASEIVEHYSTHVNAAILRGGAAAAGEAESDCLRNRRAEAAIFVARDDATGLTADEVVDHVVAPIIYRVIFAPWTLDGSTASRLVDDLFALHRARTIR